jgi:hypothetical protein
MPGPQRQGDPRRARQVGTERYRHAASEPAGRNHGESGGCADEGGEQQHERQHLPAEPGADRREQLEVAVAHAFLAGDKAEELEHEPEEHVAGDCADHGVAERHGRRQVAGSVREACHQPDPHQRNRQHVRQQLSVDVDAVNAMR